MSARITMLDVARETGVTKSTVCRALRSDPRISLSTRQRIRRAAEAMGYIPDPLLSALAARRKGSSAEITTIAWLTNFSEAMSWRTNGFYRDCYDGAAACARQHGYRLEHFWMKEPGMTAKRLSRILYNRGICALCVAPSVYARSHLSLDWSRFASVTIGYSLVRPAIHRATPHHFHGLLTTLRELRRLGYKRIGFCAYSGTSKRTDDQWLAAALVYQNYYKDIKLPVFLYDDRKFKHLAKWCRDQKLEVVIGGDAVALRQLRKSGLGVPGDIDYVTTCRHRTEMEVAGIDQRPEMVGAAAIDLLIAQLQRGERGIPEVPITMQVEGCWADGESLPRKGNDSLPNRSGNRSGKVRRKR